MIEGVPPCPRGGHTAVLSGASIVIFGVNFLSHLQKIFSFWQGHYYAGKDKGYVYLNDTYILDVNANRWNVHLLCFALIKSEFRNLKFLEHHQLPVIIIQPF